MLSFFRSGAANKRDKAEDDSPFSDQDIQNLFGKLSIETSSESKQELLPSANNDGFVQASSSLESLRQKVESGKGRIKIKIIAQELDLHVSSLQSLISRQHFILNADDTEILSEREQERLVADLNSQAQHNAIDLDNFCSIERIDKRALAILPSESVLILTHGTRYYAPSKFLTNIKSQIREDTQRAFSEKQSHIWAAEDRFGLPVQYFSTLVADVAKADNIAGETNDDGSTVTFIPQSFVDMSSTQRLSDLQNGKIAWISSAEASSSSFSVPSDGPIIVLRGYAISRKWMDVKLSDISRIASQSGHASIQDVLSDFPEESRSALQAIIQSDRLNKSMRTNINIIDQYIVSLPWIEDQRDKAEKAAADTADAAWKDDSYTKLKGSILKSRLQYEARKALDIDENVFGTVWKSPEFDLPTAAADAYQGKLSALDEACELEFKEFWGSRVMQKCYLYASSLDEISDTQLKAQLEDLLRAHIASDMVPSNSARAKSKGLTRCSKLKQGARLAKLQDQLKTTKELAGAINALRGFEAQIGISQETSIDLAAAKRAMLQELVKTMQKDQDAPRLYLTLIIITVADKQAGVVYATGKFAPKLLKLVRHSLDSDLASHLEQWKDAVKAGKITDVDREEMRSTAAKIIERHQGL